MNRCRYVSRAATTFLGLSAFAAVSAVAQTNYSSQNFSTNAGYQRGSGIISTGQPTALRWQGNDPYNAVTGTGETDLIARASGYTPPPLTNGFSSLIQGGLGIGDGVLPGTNSVRVWKTFAPSATSSFFVEWSLIPSLEGAPYNLSDTFAFDLRNAANTASLLKLQLTPGINIQASSYTLQTLATGVGTNTIVDLAYQALFQLQVDMTASNYNVSLRQINSTNRAVIASYTNLASGNLSSGTTAADFSTISLDWSLASGNNLEPGSNYLIANQFTVVPEPSTYSLLAVAVLVVSAMALRRRRA